MAEIRSEVEKCLNDDDEQSDFYKNVVIKEIEEAMILALESKTEPALSSLESEGEDTGHLLLISWFRFVEVLSPFARSAMDANNAAMEFVEDQGILNIEAVDFAICPFT
ncbi:hypothetical protein R1flu_022251 [Riccia fluitans]|uniref:Uncharacterized protein n=1 Tax=Riccia fluitans TaxID=41844 RepID=A0ABD1ZRV8_9MARC